MNIFIKTSFFNARTFFDMPENDLHPDCRKGMRYPHR